MKILITGVNGFVGSSLVSGLRDRHRLMGLDISSSIKKSNIPTFEWSELVTIPPVEVVIHLAGIAHDTQRSMDETVYYDINVGLTKKIFEYFLLSTAQKFIYFSSVKAVADMVEDFALREDVIPNPKTPYGRSKLEAETYLLSKSLPDDKYLYILRPAMIHGPGNKGNLNLLYSILKTGIPYPLGAFQNKRSFTSIQNLVFILERLIEGEIQSDVYNVCDDESLSTSEIAQAITESLGKSGRIWNIPKVIINAAARIGDIMHLPLNSERLTKMTESYVVSNQKIKEACQVAALPVNAFAGLVTTLDSFRDKNEKNN